MEPNSFEELHLWLERHSLPTTDDDSLLSQHPAELGRPRNASSVELWLVPYEAPHLVAIETAAKTIAIHGEEVFPDMLPEAASLLRLRIETAAALIEGFATTQESPFAFPAGEFQEVVPWLLIDWWAEAGRQMAVRDLFVRWA